MKNNKTKSKLSHSQLATINSQLPKGYKQTEVGVIPEDWAILTIDQISTVGRGRVINHKEIGCSQNPLYPVYSSQTSDDGIMGYLDTYEFEGEYITWTTDGANAGTVFYRNGRFNCTNVCGTIKLFRDNHRFVALSLSKIAPSHVSRQLGNPKLMNDVMKKVGIPLPPTLAEQEAIASALSDADAYIESLEKLIAKKRLIKQGAMQELLSGKRRLPGFSSRWKTQPLGEVSDLKNGYAFKSNMYNSLGKFRIITIANVQDGYMDMEECNKITILPNDIQQHQILKIGEILVSMTGNVGRVCRVTENGCLLNQRVGKLIPCNINQAFLFELLSQKTFMVDMSKKAVGGAQGNLSISDIIKYQISIPISKEEQSAIAQVLSDMDTEIETLEGKLDKARKIKEGMMQELLTGRIRLI